MTFHSNAHEEHYDRHSKALTQFLNAFSQTKPNQVLDPIYTSKTLFSVIKMIRDDV